MKSPENTDLARAKFAMSYANIFTLFFSCVYSVLLIWGHFNKIKTGSTSEIFPIYLSIVIPLLFLIAYILNLKNKPQQSKFLLISTLYTVNFMAGIKWGFDLPSLLLSYVFCIVILTLTSKPKEDAVYLFFLIGSIVVGHFIRESSPDKLYWYDSSFGINDIIEFSIMIIFISFILTKFNLEQNKTLNRALRVESVLRKERKGLETTLEEKTKEIKHMQMEEISKMYHLIEFGKLSSGLYHDLITPIQTMNLYIEKLSEEHLINDSKFSKVVLNIKNTHQKLSSMLQNIRKQIALNIQDEEFDMVTETKDLIHLLKNDYFKHGVEIILNAEENQSHILHSKKTIVNHIVLNLISNAYEACLQDVSLNQKDSYVVNISVGRHLDKYYVSVADNGIGIKHENLKNIFSNFYTTKTEEKQNCGIGLSSAKYYAEKYLGGNIFVESEYGAGTTMTLVF